MDYSGLKCYCFTFKENGIHNIMSFITSLFKKVFGSRNQRIVKRMMKTVADINALEPTLAALSDAALQAKTAEFRERLKHNETLDQLLPEAFAVVREASKRVLRMRHFDVQLIGGMALHTGRIAEMGTGEGKTLCATLPVYLNALVGKGVHIITVNDYLAKRDAAWMEPVYTFLGLSVGVIVPGLSKSQRQAAYGADITYGTNNEYGFDYLRDNMVFSFKDKVQRDLYFAVIDEVDSILIDEARTPLIISGPAEDSSDLYKRINTLIPLLTKQPKENEPGDYAVDEKARQAFLTDQGHERIEQLLVQEGLLPETENLYGSASIILMHHVNAALRAHALFRRDVDYIVRDNEIIIVDEHTGRTMQGRRWSDGLHQAVEAKENVDIKSENQTLASITFQNYFRLYDKLGGMTGTADTEAFEFQQIYGLEVLVIPTNKPNQRRDASDYVFLTAKDKFNAIITGIKDCATRQQPVLVGTASIETSEYLSSLLKKEAIEHQVLNAKFHEQEAQIIAQAGRAGAVTIATNMAGRGTDIVLGGSLDAEIAALPAAERTPEKISELTAQWQIQHEHVVASGGLQVLGSERHESRRIDNQLRGRSGRQGDPGATRFYLSLEDNLMRIFASPNLVAIMQKLGMEEGQAIESGMVTRAIENAQRKVEGRNFDIRKQLLQFDDVANEQRQVIYQQRNELMRVEDDAFNIAELRDEVVDELIAQYLPPDTVEEQWDVPALMSALNTEFQLDAPIDTWLKEDEQLHIPAITDRIKTALESAYTTKSALTTPESLHQFERSIMLQTLDTLWKEHLSAMDHLRQSVNLRGYAQKDPKQEYKRESFTLFSDMLERLKRDVVGVLCRFQIEETQELEEQIKSQEDDSLAEANYQHDSVSALSIEAAPDNQTRGQTIPFARGDDKIGRNDLCHCGSGRKFKQCHGRLESVE